jgi:hypothetical protein
MWEGAFHGLGLKTIAARETILNTVSAMRVPCSKRRTRLRFYLRIHFEVIYAASLKTLSQLRWGRVTQGKDKHHDSNSSFSTSTPHPCSAPIFVTVCLRTLSFLYATPAARSRLPLTRSSYGCVMVHWNLYARCRDRSLAKSDRHNWTASSTQRPIGRRRK